MKIAQVSPTYPPYRGGMGKVAEDYTKKLIEAGHEVEVFHPGNTKALYEWGNAAFMPSLFFKLRGYDLIHLHYPFYGGAIFTALASLVFKTPMVVTYHMKTKADGWLGLIFLLHRMVFEPFILFDAKKVMISSKDYAESITFDHENLVELPFWVDTDRFKPGVNTQVRKKFGISESSTVFLFVGGLDPAHYFKGVNVLLTAAANLPTDQEWDIMIVGDGSRKHEFLQTAMKLGLESRVHFAGRVSDEDLPGYYNASDVHVLPSIDRSEAFGLVTLEAAASNLSSIVSDLPGVRTLVEEGQTGYIVKPSDDVQLQQAMEKMMSVTDRVAMMGRLARKRVLDEYSIDAVFTKLQQIYNQSTFKKYEDRNN